MTLEAAMKAVVTAAIAEHFAAAAPGLVVVDHFGSTSPTQNAPAIGEFWPAQGGVYAGLVRGRDGTVDHHLVVGPELIASGWDSAKTQAADLVIEGHADFTLPFRAEQALLFANVPELFEKTWYWSGEQHASSPDYAWLQTFGSGSQYYGHKSSEHRARAVRRLKIS